MCDHMKAYRSYKYVSNIIDLTHYRVSYLAKVLQAHRTKVDTLEKIRLLPLRLLSKGKIQLLV